MSESFIARISKPKSKVTCHTPKLVHNYVKVRQYDSSSTAEDVVNPPKKVVISEKKSNLNTGTKPKGKYVQSRYKLSVSNDSLSTSKMKTPMHGQDAKTSTPAAKQLSPLNLDVSEINSSYAQMGLGKNKTVLTKSKSEKNCPKIKKPLSVTKSEIKRNKSTNDFEEDCAWNLYDEYLTWKFLNLKLENAKKELNTRALIDMETLSHMVMEKDDEETKLEEDIMKLEHLERLQVLDSLNDSLACISENLPNVKDNFMQLTESLDSTCHKLPLDGIAEVDITKLTSTLKETRQSLGEAAILIQSKTDTVNKMSEVSTNLANTISEGNNLCCSLENEMIETSANLLKFQSLNIQESI